jgi:hypothetical protein
VTFLAVGYGAYALVVTPGALPGGLAAAWLSSVTTYLVLGLLPFVFLWFPNGRLPSARWRPVAWTAIVVGVAHAVVIAVQPGPIYDFPFVDNPVSFAGAPGELVEWLFRNELHNLVVLAFILTLTLSVVSLAVRFRRARGQERQQLKWLAFASIPVLGFFVALVFGPAWDSRLLDAVAIALLFSAMYTAIGIAVLRHRLYDIDLLLTRTLVYGLLTAAFTVVYLVIVVGVGALVGAGGRPNLLLSIVATGVVAVAFQPARDRSRRLANRLVYGSRATPYEVLSTFSRGVTGAATDDSLPQMARLVVEATGARRATVWLRLGDVLQPQARWPQDGPLPEPIPLHSHSVDEALAVREAASRSFPVGHEEELLGALTVTISPAEPLTVAGEKLITDLAAQAGLGLRFQRLEGTGPVRQGARVVPATGGRRAGGGLAVVAIAAGGAGGHHRILRHPRVLLPGRTAPTAGGGQGGRAPPGGDGRGRHRPRRGAGQVRRRRGHGGVRRAPTGGGSRPAGAWVRGRHATPPAGPQRRRRARGPAGVPDRHRDQHRHGDRRHPRRARPAGLHGAWRRGQCRPTAAERGWGRRGPGLGRDGARVRYRSGGTDWAKAPQGSPRIGGGLPDPLGGHADTQRPGGTADSE